MNGNYKILDFCNYLLFLIFSCCLATFIVVNAVWLYLINVVLLKVNTQLHVSFNMLMHNFIKMIGFIQNPFVTELDLQKYHLSEKAFIHFENVKTIILFNNLFLLISLILLIVLFMKFDYKRNIWRMLNFIKTTWTVILIVMLLVIFDFKEVFVYFHKILFRNRDWIFNPAKDPIINTLPDQYFLTCFLLWLFIVLIMLMVFYMIGKRQIKRANL